MPRRYSQLNGVRTRVGYHIGDGIYGGFNCIPNDHATPVARALRGGGAAAEAAGEDEPPCRATLFGPTCDGLDTVLRDVPLAPDLEPGVDWLTFARMGAYTKCAASDFNGLAASCAPVVHTLGVARQDAPAAALREPERI